MSLVNINMLIPIYCIFYFLTSISEEIPKVSDSCIIDSVDIFKIEGSKLCYNSEIYL